MTKLLVSIRNEEEAALAAGFSIDILDVKEPARGALGAANRSTLQKIVDRVPQGQRMSVALGELRDWLIVRNQSRNGMRPENEDVWFNHELLTRFRFAKIGLAGMNHVFGWQDHWLEYASSLPNGVIPVGVAYLDHERCNCPLPEEILEFVGDRRDGVLLLDTFDKKSGNVLSLLGVHGLTNLLFSARRQNVMTVVAGSVTQQDISILFSLAPDFIGVRGAVCISGRERLDRQKLQNFFDEFLVARSLASVTTLDDDSP